MLDTEFNVPVLYKLLPLFFTISLTIISILFTEFYPRYVINFKYSRLGYNIFGFFNQRFLVELYYNNYVSGVILGLGAQTTKVMDKGVVEIFGPYGLEKKVTQISKQIGSLSTGLVTTYALYILTGLMFYISLIYLTGTSDHYYLLIILLYGSIVINFNPNNRYTNILTS
jgi:NADH-ubiquinone oxidoreductase chain 5